MEWNGNSEELNLSEFKTYAADKKGHSERIGQFRVQPQLARMIGEIIASRIFPYKTSADFMRHAAVRHVKYLDEIGPVQFYDTSLDAVQEILREEDERLKFDETIEKAKGQVSNHIGKGRVEHAKKLLARIQSHINDMPDDEPWKAIYQKAMKENFSEWLDDLPAVRLWEGA